MTKAKGTAETIPSNIPDEPEQMQLWRRIIDLRDWLVESIRKWEGFVAGDSAEQPYARKQIALLHAEIAKMDARINKGTRYDAKKQKGLTFFQMQELADMLVAEREADLVWWIWHYLDQKTKKKHSDARMTKGTVRKKLELMLGKAVDVDALETAANKTRTQNRVRNDGTDGSGVLERKAKKMLEIAKRA